MSGRLFFEPSISLLSSMDVDSSNLTGAEDWTQADGAAAFRSPPPPHHVVHRTPSAAVTAAALAATISIDTGHSSPPAVMPGGAAAATTIASPVTPAAFRPTAPRDSAAIPAYGMMVPAAKLQQSARSKEREQLLTSTLMFRNPLSVATLVVHGREFFVHAELLCKHSAYFSRCLRGGFAEAQTQRIDLGGGGGGGGGGEGSDDGGDLTPEDLGLWIDLLYRWHFHQPGTFVLRKEETGGTLSTMQLLTLWRLSDRFLHAPLAALAEESLQHRLGLYSAEQWRKLYRTRPAADIEARASRLQTAFRYCRAHELPFADGIVSAFANCPAQVYADCAPTLDPEFMMQVSRRMILAHADNSLLSKDQRTPAGAAVAAAGANSSPDAMLHPGM